MCCIEQTIRVAVSRNAKVAPARAMRSHRRHAECLPLLFEAMPTSSDSLVAYPMHQGNTDMSINHQNLLSHLIRLPLSICAVAVALFSAQAIAAVHGPVQGEPAMGTSMQPAAIDDMKAHQAMSTTDDGDFDFAVNMRKHHQMALTMSRAQLENGKDASMRDFASKIIAAQKAEIAVLDQWIAAHHKATAK